MSWSSLDEAACKPMASPKSKDAPAALRTKTIFDREIPIVDLTPSHFAVATVDHKAPASEREFTFAEGDSFRILGSNIFKTEGYYLAEREAGMGYGLVPCNLVQLHEAEFDSLAEIDDDLSKDSLLEDVNASTFNKGLKKAPWRTRSQMKRYEYEAECPFLDT